MDVALGLDELAALDRPALAQRWQAEFGVPAPKSCQSPLLRGALAWRLQVAAAGGDRQIQGIAKSLRKAAAASPATTLPVGTKLLREWQGRTHQVTVSKVGFEYDGKCWASLSAIARSITGSRWSGPVFFGLRS